MKYVYEELNAIVRKIIITNTFRVQWKRSKNENLCTIIQLVQNKIFCGKGKKKKKNSNKRLTSVIEKQIRKK